MLGAADAKLVIGPEAGAPRGGVNIFLKVEGVTALLKSLKRPSSNTRSLMRTPVIQEVEAVVPLGRPEICRACAVVTIEAGNPKGTSAEVSMVSMYVLIGPLTDTGTGEVIEAADQAVLSQEGEAEVLLGLDVVAGAVESLADKMLF